MSQARHPPLVTFASSSPFLPTLPRPRPCCSYRPPPPSHPSLLSLSSLPPPLPSSFTVFFLPWVIDVNTELTPLPPVRHLPSRLSSSFTRCPRPCPRCSYLHSSPLPLPFSSLLPLPPMSSWPPPPLLPSLRSPVNAVYNNCIHTNCFKNIGAFFVQCFTTSKQSAKNGSSTPHLPVVSSTTSIKNKSYI